MADKPYSQLYFNALLDELHRTQPFDDAEVIGEVGPEKPKQPHIAVVVKLGEGRYVSTTAGISALSVPVPVKEGFTHFELCAFTQRDSPKVLWMLSNLAQHMLSTLSPFFYGNAAPQVNPPAPRPFLPYETMRFEEDGERLLLVPRAAVSFEYSPPRVDVVEPLPIPKARWPEIAELDTAGRKAWVDRLGLASAKHWDSVIDAQ